MCLHAMKSSKQGTYVGHFLNQMPIFGCYMAKIVVKNGNCKDMCHDEIGTCARYICVILGSKVSSQLRRSSLLHVITSTPPLRI